LGDGQELTGISIDMVMKTAGLIEWMGKEIVRPKKKSKTKS
jgi:hypothetical protein